MTTYKETCSIKDEGRPFEIGLQDQVSNCPKVMGIKSACGERLGKRWNKIHQVCAEKMNESEPLMKHRKCKEVIETKLLALAWDRIWEVPVYCPSGGRCTGGMSSVTGFYREHGNLSSRCKGRSSSGRTTRGRVPMRGTGADQLVVVMKSSNADGAKGLNHPTDTRSQLEIGRTNGRSKVGTYQSDDKSRMKRESEAGQKPS